VAVPGIGEAGYWSDPPTFAIYGLNPLGVGPSDCWTVHGLPPEPWPWGPVGHPLSVDVLGPDYTVYEFSPVEYGVRLAFGYAAHPDLMAAGLAAWNAPPLVPGKVVYLVQIVPGTRGVPVTVDLWRVSVHATLGGVEESINVFHLEDLANGPVHTIDAAGALQVAQQVAATWTDMMKGTGYAAAPGVPAAYPLSALFPTDVQWDEVRCARVQLHPSIPTPPAVGALKPDGTPERHTIYVPVKPTYVVDTQYAPFVTPADVKGSSATTLPYEVACCVSFGTGIRGGRNRGRMFLGPLGPAIVGAQGKFDDAMVHIIGHHVAEMFLRRLPALAPGLALTVASGRYATARLVTDMRVGHVPDSQRRRRRSQDEVYAAFA
jgi:hypothetical protein